MTHPTPHTAPQSATPSGLIFVGSLAAGLVLCLLTLASLHFFGAVEAGRRASERNLDGLRHARANVDSLWDQVAFFAQRAGEQLNEAGPKALDGLLAQQRNLWPEVDLSLFDQKGEALPSSGESEARPSGRSVRAVVHKALVGQSARDVTRSGAHVSLSVSFPLHSGNIRALVVTLPLNNKALQLLGQRSSVNLAILPVDDSGKPLENSLASAANTFALAGGDAALVWEEIRGNPPQPQSNAPMEVNYAKGGRAGVLLLEDVLGVPTGMLITHVEAETGGSQWARNLAVAMAVGLVGALLSALCLHFYSRRMGESFAVAAVALAERNRESADNAFDDWPPALQEALTKIAGIVKDYRRRVRTAEVQLDAVGRQVSESGKNSRNVMEDDDYLRLFENTPVGVFQAERSGAFLRVNQAFALMLGYDTPVMLLTENVSFTDLCLYGDEIRNPLSMLFEQGGGRQIISLRKRDGKTGDYILTCVPITSASGDMSSIAEGFLLDRDLEDQLSRAERERELADRQRTSLALLLAATSLQTRSVLALPQSQRPPESREAGVEVQPDVQADAQAEARPGEGEEGQERRDDRRGPPERRQSVLAISDVMADIYKIAMTEASAAAPVEVPIELGRFLRRLCRQAFPQLRARGISLSCELAEELPARFNGPAPMLRHTLQRAILAMAAPVRGGWCSLSVRRDPNSPRSPGLSRILFSASWSPYRHEDGQASYVVQGRMLPGREEFIEIFGNESPEAEEQELPSAGTLEIGDEQEVIRYLAQRMHGDLLEGVISSTLRSMQILVPLSHAGDYDEQAQAPRPRFEEGLVNPEDPALMGATPNIQPGDGYMDLSGMGGDEAAPLSILVEDMQDASSETGQAQRGPGLNILLVDDSLNNRLLFSLYLRDTRHRITEAHNGQDGVEAFKRGRYDVIFMDMEMPLMDGYQATRIIRALEADSDNPPTPIVGMTSYALPEFRRQCMLSGCTDFLSKPFSKIALYSVLDAFCQLQEEDEGQGVGTA